MSDIVVHAHETGADDWFVRHAYAAFLWSSWVGAAAAPFALLSDGIAQLAGIFTATGSLIMAVVAAYAAFRKPLVKAQEKLEATEAKLDIAIARIAEQDFELKLTVAENVRIASENADLKARMDTMTTLYHKERQSDRERIDAQQALINRLTSKRIDDEDGE